MKQKILLFSRQNKMSLRQLFAIKPQNLKKYLLKLMNQPNSRYRTWKKYKIYWFSIIFRFSYSSSKQQTLKSTKHFYYWLSFCSCSFWHLDTVCGLDFKQSSLHKFTEKQNHSNKLIYIYLFDCWILSRLLKWWRSHHTKWWCNLFTG